MYIPGTAPMKRSNLLIINEHKIKMPDESFKLLIEMVVKLKKAKVDGCLNILNLGSIRYMTD